MLDRGIKITNRRVNALEKVVCPKIENTIIYITSELEEIDREDLYRLKKIRKKKIRDAEKKRDELKAKLGEKQAEEVLDQMNKAATEGGSGDLASRLYKNAGASTGEALDIIVD